MRAPIRVASICAALTAIILPGLAQAHHDLSVDTVRSELIALYDGLESAHFDLFAHRSEPDYRAFRDAQLAAVTGPMSPQQAAIRFQELAAYGRVGHANVDAPTRGFVAGLQAGGRFVPVFIRVDGDQVFLTETADSEGRFTAGDEVLALNGEAVSIWLDRLGRYVSAERPYMAQTLMEQSFPALLQFALGDTPSLPLSVRKPSGEIVTSDLHAITLAQRAAIRRDHPTGRLATDFTQRRFELLPQDIGYLRPGPFAEPSAARATDPNYDSTAFQAFIDRSFEQLIEAGATDLILDLRNNSGGDNSFSDPMVAWFADRPFRFASSFTLKASAETKDWYQSRLTETQTDGTLRALADADAAQPNGTRYAYDLPLSAPRPEPRFDGTVHVLVNRHSYSNAALVAAMIQDYGFGQVLGEETADVPTTYASVLTFRLPLTETLVTYPKSRIVRPNGDETLRGVIPDTALAREPIGATEDLVLGDAIATVLARRDVQPD